MNMKLVKRNTLVTVASFTALVFASSTLFAHDDWSELDDDMDQGERIAHIITKGSMAQINELIEQGLTINQDIESEGTPLILAVQRGNKQLVEHFLTLGADVNQESLTDGNALIVAALENNLQLVEYLHNSGAQIDAVTKYDETALISASRAGHFKVVKYLVENGADVNLSVMANVRGGKELRSPLNGAKTTQIKDYLISQGAKS